MNQLYLSLNKAGLMFKTHTEHREVDFIHLETDENGTTCSVDVNTFEILFGDVQENPDYKALPLFCRDSRIDANTLPCPTTPDSLNHLLH
ncbi:hypothetical protein [Priestia megaterium]